MKKFLLVSVLTVSLGMTLVGCAADKDADDYQNAEAEKLSGELAPAAKSFIGNPKLKVNGQDLGPMELDLQVVTNSVQGSSATNSSQVLLQGQVNFQALGASINVTDVNYDYDSGTLTVNIPVTLQSGGSSSSSGSGNGSQSSTQGMLIMNGTVSGNTYTGSITANGVTSLGADFTLTASGSSSTVSSTSLFNRSSGAPTPVNAGLSKVYLGSTLFSTAKESRSVVIVISQPSITPQQQFYNLFAASQMVDVTLNYGDAVILDHANCQWNMQSNTINGCSATLSGGSATATGSTTTVVSGSGAPIQLNLSCQVSGNAIACDHSSNEGADIATTQATLTSDNVQTALTSLPTDSQEDQERGTESANFSGSMTLAGVNYGVTATAIYDYRSRGQDISLLLTPDAELPLVVSFQFVNGSDLSTLALTSATWDSMAQTLDGTATVQDPQDEETFNTAIHCDGFNFIQTSGQVTCQYINSVKGLSTMTLALSSTTTSQGQSLASTNPVPKPSSAPQK